MLIKTKELEGRALDFFVAHLLGRAVRRSVRVTMEDLKSRRVPFELWSMDVNQPRGVSEPIIKVGLVEVFRKGNLPGCSSPTLSFVDLRGIRCCGHAELFFPNEDEILIEMQAVRNGRLEGFYPSSNWAHGGPVVEKLQPFGLTIIPVSGRIGNPLRGGVEASIRFREHSYTYMAPDILMACTRLFVGWQMGHEFEFDLPKEFPK